MGEFDEYQGYGKYCATCGGEMEWIDCYECGGEGGFDGDRLMEEDPLWYDEDDYEICTACLGLGGHWHCFSEHAGGDSP